MTEMPESIGYKGEDALKHRCNRWKCEYLEIVQEPGDAFSHEIRAQGSKRCDFLVNVPYVGPILIDVKTKKLSRVGRSSRPAFSVNKDDYERLHKLQDRMSLRVWYAFFRLRDGDSVDRGKAYLMPLSRVERYMKRPEIARILEKGFFYAPTDCMNECDEVLVIKDVCAHCEERSSCGYTEKTQPPNRK